MELRQLRSFRKIAEMGSFSKAANVLCLTQPALGLQIKNLEEELGVPLLTRHSRGVVPTRQGVLLLQRAETILAEVDSAVREAKGEGPRAVRIGMAPTLAAMLSVSLSRRTADSSDDVRLELTEAPTKTLNDWLAQGEIDLAVACEGPVGRNILREVVLEEALYLVQPAVPNEPAIGYPVEFVDLADMPLFVADPLLTRMLVDKLQSEAAIASIRLHIRGVLPSMAIVKNLVEDGEGATVLPYAVVRRECEQNRLRVRRIVGPTLSRNAYMLSHVDRPQAACVRQLIRDVISEQIRGTPEHGRLAAVA